MNCPYSSCMSKAQFFIGILFQPQVLVEQIQPIIQDAFGPIEDVSEIFEFNHTNYYEDEMGASLQRIFFTFKGTMEAAQLVKWKEIAVQIEEEFFKKKGKRFVNVDPGYLDSVKIILASNKQGGHKIALTETVYADMVMDYFKGEFRFFDWTFPDFKSGLYSSFFINTRRKFLDKGYQPQSKP